MSDPKFTCPRCGGRTWGSSYNFDGPGDTPMTQDPAKGPVTSLDTGGRSTCYEGTFTRMCHGYVENGSRSCGFTWNSRDDLKYGIEPATGTSVGAVR